MPLLIKPESEKTKPPFRPIAHIGRWGTQVALCGAEILGVFAYGEYDLCLRCKELNGGDPRLLRARG